MLYMNKTRKKDYRPKEKMGEDKVYVYFLRQAKWERWMTTVSLEQKQSPCSKKPYTEYMLYFLLSSFFKNVLSKNDLSHKNRGILLFLFCSKYISKHMCM